MAQEVNKTLDEREPRYGNFMGHARVSQLIQEIMITSYELAHPGKKWTIDVSFDQRESLLMISNKLGRIINGDPDYIDTWHDIAGYATLVANRLESDKSSK